MDLKEFEWKDINWGEFKELINGLNYPDHRRMDGSVQIELGDSVSICTDSNVVKFLEREVDSLEANLQEANDFVEGLRIDNHRLENMKTDLKIEINKLNSTIDSLGSENKGLRELAEEEGKRLLDAAEKVGRLKRQLDAKEAYCAQLECKLRNYEQAI